MEEGIAKGLEKEIERNKIESAKALLDVLDDDIIAQKLKLDINIVRSLR